MGQDDEEPTPPANNKNDQATASPSATPTHPQTGPAVKTAAGRVFYGGGGITPDIEVRTPAGSPLRNRIIDEAFYFTRLLAAGVVPGLETYRVDKVQYGAKPKATDVPVNDRLVEAFRDFVKADTQAGFTIAQLETELDYVKLRLREEVLSAALVLIPARVLLEAIRKCSDNEALPEAKRLAERRQSLRKASISLRRLTMNIQAPHLCRHSLRLWPVCAHNLSRSIGRSTRAEVQYLPVDFLSGVPRTEGKWGGTRSWEDYRLAEAAGLAPVSAVRLLPGWR